MIKNTYEITEVIEPDAENCPVAKDTAYIYGLWLEGASWDRENRLVIEQSNSAIYDKFPVIRVTTELMTQAEMDAMDGTLSDFEDNPPLTKKDVREKEENDLKIKEQMEREDKLRSQMRQDVSKSKLQPKERGEGATNAQGLSRINSRVGGSRQSLRQSTDSAYNFKGKESVKDDDVKSKRSKKSRPASIKSRRSSNASESDNKSQVKSPRKHTKPPMVKPPSGLSDIAKREFAEDSREDEESSDMTENEEEKARKWRENIYYYKCPVFRVSGKGQKVKRF